MGKALDLTGQKFGRLTVIEKTERRQNSSIIWKCKCSCGKIHFSIGSPLIDGRTKSCGCYKLGLHTSHGKHLSPTYCTWGHMVNRCSNPNNDGWHLYGGRGIKVCDRWLKFENFYHDMGERPIGKTLDRYPNKNGNYEPSNTRWATPKEQSNNTNSQFWFLGYHEKTGEWDEDNNQYEFAKRYNLSASNISMCLSGKKQNHKGWIFKRLPI